MLNDLLPKTLAFYTKWTYTTQAHLYSNFSLISVDVDSLNFVHFSQKNISWYVPRTATQHEIPLINFEKGFPETIAQHVIWNLIVVQIKGEFKFIELGHAKDTQRCCSRYSLWREWYTPWHSFLQGGSMSPCLTNMSPHGKTIVIYMIGNDSKENTRLLMVHT